MKPSFAAKALPFPLILPKRSAPVILPLSPPVILRKRSAVAESTTPLQTPWIQRRSLSCAQSQDAG